MNDEENKLRAILFEKWRSLGLIGGAGHPENFKKWSEALAQHGCRVFRVFEEVGEIGDDVLIEKSSAVMGKIRIPRDLAMKILVLGELP